MTSIVQRLLNPPPPPAPPADMHLARRVAVLEQRLAGITELVEGLVLPDQTDERDEYAVTWHHQLLHAMLLDGHSGDVIDTATAGRLMGIPGPRASAKLLQLSRHGLAEVLPGRDSHRRLRYRLRPGPMHRLHQPPGDEHQHHTGTS